MVNHNEMSVVRRYEAEGWKTLRGGAPDFVFVKVENGEIKDFVFVEVKTPKDIVSYEQTIYGKILEKLGANYKVEVVHDNKPTQATPDHPTPNQTRPAHSRPAHYDPDQTVSIQTIPHHPILFQTRPLQAKPNQPNPLSKLEV